MSKTDLAANDPDGDFYDDQDACVDCGIVGWADGFDACNLCGNAVCVSCGEEDDITGETTCAGCGGRGT